MNFLRMIGFLFLLIALYAAGEFAGFERGKRVGIDATIAEIEKQAKDR